MNQATPSVEPSSAVVHDPFRKRMILVAVSVALMAVISSMSGLNVAQQVLAIEFGASQSTILWIINAYTLALASLLMPIGAIGDRWGRKPVLLTGLAVFGVASIVGALAGSATIMIISRLIAGIGAAMIMPVTLSVITTSFPEEERGQAIGIWAGIAGGGAMVGMFVSSAMVDLVTWRWLFALPIVLVAVGLVLTARFVPNSAEDTEHPFDVIGSIMSLLAIGGLVLGIQEGPERGWFNPLTFSSLTVGLVAAGVFIVWELRHPAPLFDIRTFADRRLAAGSVTLLSLFAVMSGIFLVLFPFFQAVLEWSALRSASAMLPMAAVMMPASALVPKLSARIGSRPTLLAGMGLAATGLATLALSASADGGYLSVLPGLLIIGLGTGLAMTPSTEAITSSLPADKQGVASALNDTTREIGGAVGVALLGSILSAGYRTAITPHLGVFPAEVAETAKEGIGAAFAAAPGAGAQAPDLIHTAQLAFVEGWTRSMWFGVAIIMGAFVFVALRGPREKSPLAPSNQDLSIQNPADQDPELQDQVHA
ncbi:MAG TPA: MFS transporter [Microthrixaceae bacterium]|nr:MFS transporter [Microthrixaceae bacterium]